MPNKIKRCTTYCPIEGSSLTKIYKKTLFGWKKIIQYRMEFTQCRTIGLLERHLGRPSVKDFYGTITGYIYLFKRDL